MVDADDNPPTNVFDNNVMDDSPNSNRSRASIQQEEEDLLRVGVDFLHNNVSYRVAAIHGDVVLGRRLTGPNNQLLDHFTPEQVRIGIDLMNE